MSTAKKPAAQVEYSKKAATLKAASDASRMNVTDAAAVKEENVKGLVQAKTYVNRDPSAGLRLLSKPEVLEKIGVSYPCLWSWMRQGKFPRSRDLGGRIAWLESEINDWIANLPVRKLKGDVLVVIIAIVGTIARSLAS
jgi:predicted DNA-binding transcriptional regulator AlpA